MPEFGVLLYAAWLPVLAVGTGYWAHAAWQRLAKLRRHP